MRPTAYRDLVANLAPTYYWRLSEPTGTRAIDQMNRANATYSGTMTRALTGPLPDGGAIKTGTISGFVDGGSGAMSQTGYTLMVWLNPSANTGDRGLLGRWGGAGGAMLYADNGTPFGLTCVHTATAGNYLRNFYTPILNTWTMAVSTWDGATLTGYANGVFKNSKAMATAPGTAAENWQVGKYGSASATATASFSEAAYFPRALSAGQIADIYSQALGR